MKWIDRILWLVLRWLMVVVPVVWVLLIVMYLLQPA